MFFREGEKEILRNASHLVTLLPIHNSIMILLVTPFCSWCPHPHFSHVVILYYKTFLWVQDVQLSPLVYHQIKEYPKTFWIIFRRSICACHIPCSNVYCDYIHHNRGLQNNTEWSGSTLLSFVVGNVPPTTSTINCKVCRSTHVYIALCHAQII